MKDFINFEAKLNIQKLNGENKKTITAMKKNA
jgi:hypothetical protein